MRKAEISLYFLLDCHQVSGTMLPRNTYLYLVGIQTHEGGSREERKMIYQGIGRDPMPALTGKVPSATGQPINPNTLNSLNSFCAMALPSASG